MSRRAHARAPWAARRPSSPSPAAACASAGKYGVHPVGACVCARLGLSSHAHLVLGLGWRANEARTVSHSGGTRDGFDGRARRPKAKRARSVAFVGCVLGVLCQVDGAVQESAGGFSLRHMVFGARVFSAPGEHQRPEGQSRPLRDTCAMGRGDGPARGGPPEVPERVCQLREVAGHPVAVAISLSCASSANFQPLAMHTHSIMQGCLREDCGSLLRCVDMTTITHT